MTPDQPNPSTTLIRMRRQLRTIAARVRVLLLARSLLLVVSVFVAGLLLLGLADFLLRLPSGVRMLSLLGVLVLIARLVHRSVLPALRTRLRDTDVALMIERHDPALRGLLASAIDLEHEEEDRSYPDERETHALREAALRTASRRLEQARIPSVLRPRVIVPSMLSTTGVLITVLMLALLSPLMLRVGAQRVLTPWVDARWPVRYAIYDVTTRDPRAADVPVPLRALVGRSTSSLDDTTRTLVNWRVLDEQGDAIGEWSRTLLMPQGKRDAEQSIPIYEQLLDVRDRVARRPESQRFTLEYSIRTRDDRTGTRRLMLVRPPRLTETSIILELPEYAQVIAGSGVVSSGTVSPEQGEARITPVLAGTRVRARWAFSKPIAESEDVPSWISAISGMGDVLAHEFDTDSSITIELIASHPGIIEPTIRDRNGVPVREPITLALEVIDDLSPGVRLTEPVRDESLSANAVVELKAELSDDLGLTSARLLAQVSSPPAGSSGAPPEPRGDPVTIHSQQIDNLSRSQIGATLSLESLDLAPGDEVRVWAMAWDLRATPSDALLGSAESATRVLRIVSTEELVEQVRRSLDPLRSNLRSLDERQGEVQELVRDASPRAGDEQRSLSERLRANQNAVEQLEQTLDRNRIDDEQLRQIVQDAAEVLDEATQQSDRAEEQIRRGNPDSAQERQRQVRNRLGDLLSMLDQGQDAWLALRNMQRLQSDLEQLKAQTEELAQRTAGQSLDELSPDDRSTLERILDQQLQTAEDAREAINTLDEQAQRLEEQDPTQAEALRQAAQQARAAQLEQKLREAGAQIQQNQTSSAAQSQQEVLDELEQLLEELENTIRNRDNALRRELASIIESLKTLIDAQEREIIRLDAMKLDNVFDGMDQRIIALVRNTLSVRDEALGAFPETRSIADHVTRAGNAQNAAIVALRANPINPKGAQQSQQDALQHLRNALEEAQRLDDQAAQRQLERAREELRKQYAEALDTQARIHDETVALGEDRLDRRARSQARAIAQEQEALRDVLEQFPQEHEGLAEAPMFTLAHDQLERLMSQSRDGLGESEINQRTRSAQRQAMSILASLIDVLNEQQQQQQENFEDGSDSGGQSGGSQQGGGDEPLIPPVAELKLLRSMQQMVADQTRALSEESTADPDLVRAVGVLQKQLFEQGRALIDRMNPSSPPVSPDSGEEPVNPDPIKPVETDGEQEP